MRLVCVATILIGTAALAPRGAAADGRPTMISMGASATAESAPFTRTVLGLPVTVDAGTIIDGEVWWHASASFGAGEARAEGQDGDGHVFDLRTGPRVQHCWGIRFCLGASLEVSWGHSRWKLDDRADSLSYDDVGLEGRIRTSIALSPAGQARIELSVGPRLRYYLRGESSDGYMLDHIDEPLARGVAGGVALVVRN